VKNKNKSEKRIEIEKVKWIDESLIESYQSGLKERDVKRKKGNVFFEG
jgi:hypothetical protein